MRPGQEEPKITINGILLSEKAAMTIRVAIESFDDDLKERGLGEDEVGKGITAMYRSNIVEIRKCIFGT